MLAYISSECRLGKISLTQAYFYLHSGKTLLPKQVSAILPFFRFFSIISLWHLVERDILYYMSHESPKPGIRSEGEPKKKELSERQESGRKILNDIGTIDFSSEETGVNPLIGAYGINKDGTPMTPEQYIKNYEDTYDDQDPKMILAVAENELGPNGYIHKPELLEGIKNLLKPDTAVESIETSDPLTGTEYEGVPDEELYYRQSLLTEHGTYVNVGDGGYRKAFTKLLRDQGQM